LISAVGIISDVRNAVSMDLKTPGNYLMLVGGTNDEMGGSEYNKSKGFIGNSVPKVRSDAKKTVDAVTKAIDEGYVRSCHDLSEGGLAVAAAEMAFAGGRGAEIYLDYIPERMKTSHKMFSETPTRFLIEYNGSGINNLMRDEGVDYKFVGSVRRDKSFLVYDKGKNVVDTNIGRLRKAWSSTIK
jgi:phosphoribosylformylglycinamidine synthase